jgi:hypothetical protein
MASKQQLLDRAVDWIAMNDEPTWTEAEDVATLISVMLVAEVFERPVEQVAKRIVLLRKASDP